LKERNDPSLDDMFEVYKRRRFQQEVCSPSETNPANRDSRNIGLVHSARNWVSSQRSEQFDMDLFGWYRAWFIGDALHSAWIT